MLDDSLVGYLLLLRWSAPLGWQFGTLICKYDQTTPRLFKKFNYQAKYNDGLLASHMLDLDYYGGGATAAYGSWVLLEKVAAAPSLPPSPTKA